MHLWGNKYAVYRLDKDQWKDERWISRDLLRQPESRASNLQLIDHHLLLSLWSIIITAGVITFDNTCTLAVEIKIFKGG